MVLEEGLPYKNETNKKLQTLGYGVSFLVFVVLKCGGIRRIGGSNGLIWST